MLQIMTFVSISESILEVDAKLNHAHSVVHVINLI